MDLDHHIFGRGGPGFEPPWSNFFLHGGTVLFIPEMRLHRAGAPFDIRNNTTSIFLGKNSSLLNTCISECDC